jgi:hypothetical protein
MNASKGKKPVNAIGGVNAPDNQGIGGTPAPSGGLFGGPNPFAALKPFPANGLDGGPGLPTGPGGLADQQEVDKEGAEEEGLFDELMQGNTALTELNNMQALSDLLNASFLNMPVPQDQEVVDPKHPVSVWQQDRSTDLLGG